MFNGDLAFKVEDYVFVDGLPVGGNVLDSANVMANGRYNKSLQQLPGPYRIIRVQLHTVTVEEE